eukprot:TRINITY_DN4924_c0_g1_i2.p1 TRINITY_DN4924_c0_g1~~TRINITY_DN4924_c0_g1_i2.p1  ORF type:complete len:398 (-),score=114.02 TRINITY_DN4924_c0_g1_i2:157-1254(-)
MVQEDLGSNATGILLAILGNFLISLSLNITKHAHNINQNGPHPEVPYTQMPIWWLGMMTMALGELGNFTAYAFAPATLVSPLGAVTIIANAMLASTFLGETMRRRDKVGCVFTVLGGVILVMFAPQDIDNVSVTQLEADLLSPIFIVFTILLVVGVMTLIYYSKQFGSRYVLVYILICSMLGGITVLCVKAVSSFVRMLFIGQNNFSSPLPWLLIITAAVTGVIQIKYLNKALEVFGATEVVPVYYVCFTLWCILGAAVLYKEFAGMLFSRIIGFIAGCIVTFLGVYMITGDRRGDEHPHDIDMSKLGDEEASEDVGLMEEHRNGATRRKNAGEGNDHDDELDEELEDEYASEASWSNKVKGVFA